MAGPGIKIEGLDRFSSTLDAAISELADMSEAVEKTNAQIMAEARRRAPRRTGRLASSITTSRAKNEALIGSGLVYAPPIHWGWPARGITPSLFLTGAAESTQPAWIGFFEDNVEKAVRKVKGA